MEHLLIGIFSRDFQTSQTDDSTHDMNAIAIIPARGGSKRIPRKNIKMFNGKPMLAWTIEKAQKSKLFDDIIVSTDDEEIASIAREYGATCNELRSSNISDDHTSVVDVMNFEANQLLDNKIDPKYLCCCLYATSPFLTRDSIKKGIDCLSLEKIDFALSVKEFENSPLRSLKIDENGYLEYKFNQYASSRTQDLEVFYSDAGQFVVAKIETWAKTKNNLNGNIFPIKISKFESIDIDDESDWKFAEELFHLRQAEQ